MHKRIVFPVVAKALLLICLISTTVFSQDIPPIKITSPTVQAVYQRDNTGQRAVTITGTFSVPMDKIEVRAVSVVPGQGVDTPWQDLQVTPAGGVFSGKLTLFGGWYTVEVRGVSDGKIVGRDVLARLGVGEVFIIAGQSNAQGLKEYPWGPSAQDDRVLYIDNYNNDELGQYHDLLTDPVPPTFSKVTRNMTYMSPRGQTPWCWGLLGDMLVQKLSVPVLFINVAWEGTSIENWSYSAQGLPTRNKYGNFLYKPEMPYANLRIAARNYAHQYGVRSILWMQGETDALYKTSQAFYRDNLQLLINRLATETRKRITWVIARTSRTSMANSTVSFVNPTIIAAQNDVLNTNFNPVFPGPETDNYYTNRGDGTHFVGTSPSDEQGTITALTELANAWYGALDANFFAQSTPVAPADVPAVSASCVTENNAVRISLPDGFTSYEWNTGEKTSSISVSKAGTYRATVRDEFGNSALTSVVVLENDAKPVTPTITQSGSQQACADSTFQFSVSENADNYSWYKQGSNTPLATGPIAEIGESGNYFVRGENIFGCVSDNSAAASLVIRPKISKPVIEASGPFSITAKIAESELNASFLWRRPGDEADTTASLIKILRTGTYSTKAKVTFLLGNNSLTCYSDTASREFQTVETNDVVIYPNPAFDHHIYIESRDNIRNAVVTVFDIYGRTIKTTTPRLLDSRLQVNLGYLPTGKYMIRVTGEGQSLTKQIIVR